jgi:hypothetical protein
MKCSSCFLPIELSTFLKSCVSCLLVAAFGMKRSSCFLLVELSTFLKPCVSRLLEALCYSSLGALVSFGDGMSGK